ncbi:bacillithiol biosynthesis deacetylase BshB1, partial [Bacteroidota bacterium]
DAELSMGGTIALLTYNGIRVGIVDLTEGELSTRGIVTTRRKETQSATKILKLSARKNLKLADGSLNPNIKLRNKIISEIRRYKPEVVFAPYFEDRHPDHIATSKLIKEAVFYSGVPKVKTVVNGNIQKSFRPDKLYYYMQTYVFQPSFIVDISKFFSIKMKAVKAYKSQFFNPSNKEPQTFISDPKFINYLEARAKYYGFLIRKEYGEPFYSEEGIEFDLLNFIKPKI